MADGPEVSVEYTLQFKDVYSPFRWDRRNFARWVVAIVLCYIFYDLYTKSTDALRSFESGSSILAILAVLFIFILFAILVFPFLRARAVFRGTPGFAKSTRVTFRPDNILFETESGKSECKWTTFVNILETSTLFFFSQGKIGGTYVPKRCFGSPADIESLRQLVRENFKGKATLRRD
jgi:hypothetical protein